MKSLTKLVKKIKLRLQIAKIKAKLRVFDPNLYCYANKLYPCPFLDTYGCDYPRCGILKETIIDDFKKIKDDTSYYRDASVCVRHENERFRYQRLKREYRAL